MPTTALKTTLQLRSAEPLYKQISRNLLQCLAAGEWKPGSQLPTEHELAERFGVAIYTVRAGIGELVAAGILARRQGKGTFVARHERDRQRQRFSRIFDDEDRKPVFTKEVVANFRKQHADRRAMDLLRLGPRRESFVYYWETTSEERERAFGFRHITVPAHLFHGLTARALRERQQNIYGLYQDLCGVNVIRMEDRVRATRADAHVAKILGMSREAPLLQIDRIAFTYDDVPVELRTRFFDGSRYHYHADQFGT